MIARERIEEQLNALGFAAVSCGTSTAPHDANLIFASNSKCFSNMIGNAGVNKKYFAEAYPKLHITYKEDNSLRDNEYAVRF